MFGIPYVVVTYNSLWLTDKKLNEFMDGLDIKYRVISIEHTQANDHAKMANKVIMWS